MELRFNIVNSHLLTDDEKSVLAEKLNRRINHEGDLIIVSQSERSQLRNKEKTIERFYNLLEKALIPPKIRKSTKPSKAAVEKRLTEKKIRSEKKLLRKKKTD